MSRDLSHTNPAQAAAGGWVVDKGDPGEWECVCKAHSSTMMKSTKRMKVPGGWLYQVTTESREPFASAPNPVVTLAEALAFVPEG